MSYSVYPNKLLNLEDIKTKFPTAKIEEVNGNQFLTVDNATIYIETHDGDIIEYGFTYGNSDGAKLLDNIFNEFHMPYIDEEDMEFITYIYNKTNCNDDLCDFVREYLGNKNKR